MKTLLASFIALLCISCSVYGQSGKQPPKANGKALAAEEFKGQWKGNERCQNISAAVAIIEIIPKSSQEVIIRGLYSTSGDIIGKINGNSIVVPKQTIPDPLFMHLSLEGTFTLSKNQKSLTAVFNVVNNDARDQCSATYNKQ
jgi:hypothetical protein